MQRKVLVLSVAVALMTALLTAGPAGAIKVYVNPSIQTNNQSPDGVYNEGYAMQDVATRLMGKLTNRGFSARNSGWLSLSGACNDAVSWDADSFLALHTNAMGSGWNTGRGTEGYYYRTNSGWYDPQDYNLCDRCVHKCVEKFSAWGRGYDRGTFGDEPRLGYHLYVLANTPGMNAVLIEGLFHDNYDDVHQVLKWDYGKEAYAQAMFEATCDFYGWSYGTEVWNSAYNAQSYTASMTPGQQAIVWAEYRNTGNTTWNIGGSYPVRLGTWNPQDRSSAFYTAGNWLGPNRPTEMDSATCAPNEIERFTFIMTAPAATGTYKEYWRLVAENKTWFGYDGVYFQVTVSNPKGNITGRITDAGTGAGIGSATVSLNTGASVTADANGYYTFSNLDPATYTVTASMANYNSNSASSTVTAGGTTTTNIALTHQVGNLVGYITDSTTGTAINGATVQLTGGGSVTTDSNGYYAFNNLNSGATYTVTASKAGYVTKAQSKLVSAGIDNWNSIALLPDRGNIHGRVTNASDGAAISGATVTITGGASTTTNAIGDYAFDNIASGTYTVSVSAPGFQSNSDNVNVTAGATTSCNIALIPNPGVISGTITDASNGITISGATVSIPGMSTITDGNGNYTLTNVPVGSYTVTASAPAYVNNTASAVVISDQTTICNIALQPDMGALSGQITESGYGGISGATVSVDTGQSTTTDANGYYTLNYVPSGSRTVTASASYFNNNSAGATVTANQTTTCNITLTRQTGNLVGLIKDNVTQAIIVGANCTIPGIGTVQTNSAGKYTFTGLRAGVNYTVTASCSGYFDNSKERFVNPGIDNWNSFNLTPHATLTGTITSSAGGAVGGATVTLSNGRTATTDSSGVFTIGALEAGTFTMTVSDSLHLDWSGQVTTTAGSTTTQNATLTRVADVIIDNTAAEFSVTGSWSTGTSTGKYGTDYRYRSTYTTEDYRATWSLNLPKSGSYAVYAWWVSGSNRTTAAKYYANHSSGSALVTVNQSTGGGTWQYLGTWNFNTSGNSIQLSNNAPNGKVVIADAVKLVKQ